MKNLKVLIALFFIFYFFIVSGAWAFDSTSSNFKIQGSAIESISGKSSSTNFKNQSAGGQISTGISSNLNKIYSGILYRLFPLVTGAVCGNNIKESGEECDGYDLGSTSCTSLGYSGGTLGCSTTCKRQTSSCISTTPQASTTPTINFSSGGETSLVNSDNTTSIFNFPQNFYTEDLKLQANSYANDFFVSNKPAPSGKNFVSKTYDFSFTTLLEAQVVTISDPVTITISYLDSDVSGLDESTLAPYRWGTDDTSWQLISGATVDTTNNEVTFSTTQFSSFALFGSPPAQQQQSGSGGGGVTFVIPLPKTPTVTKCGVADLNCDGQVGLEDLSILIYFMSRPAPQLADLDKDLKISIKDFSILFSQWNERSPVFAFEKPEITIELPKTEETSLAREQQAAAGWAASPEEKGPVSIVQERARGMVSKLLKTFTQFISNVYKKVREFFISFFR